MLREVGERAPLKEPKILWILGEYGDKELDSHGNEDWIIGFDTKWCETKHVEGQKCT